jgi:TonB family protein
VAVRKIGHRAMESTQQDRVMAVVSAALLKPPWERDSYLRLACGSNADLYREARAVVQKEVKMGSFLRHPMIMLSGLSRVGHGPGRNIGPYEILSEIGRGGMGVVYKCKDPRNGQSVAVKLLSGSGAVDPSGRMGLVREARVTGQLRHPHIVRIHDIGQHEGRLFLVMELVEGCPLDRIIKYRLVIDLRDKLNLMIQLCSGLGYAHAHGVLHRDIKPANILRLNNGRLKIVDFGIAKVTEIAGQFASKDTNTRLAGTPHYMSPERLSGASADVSSDLWSVGVTLYELLTWTRPFSASSFRALAKSVGNDPVPLLDSSMPLKSELTQVLERALAKDWSIRYSTADELAGDLQAILLTLDAEHLIPQPARDVDIRAPLLDSVSSEETSYRRIELGLAQRASRRVNFRTTKFTQSGWLESIKQSLGNTNFAFLAKLGFLLSTFSFIVLLVLQLILIFLSLYHDIPGNLFEWALFAVPISLVGLLVFTVRRANVTLPRKCQSCFLRRMVRVSKWTRFVTSNTEISWGLNDCIAALQDGYYEDAAKLLSVHGAVNAAVYAVIRYNLEFWECRKCLDQSGILIVEEKIESRWCRDDLYHESYVYAAVAGSRAAISAGRIPLPEPGRSAPRIIARLNEILATAKAARVAGDWNLAIAVMREATALDPSRDLLWAKLGEAYRGAKNYRESATAYKKAIGIKPLGVYYNNLADVYGKLGLSRLAVQAYRNAVEVDSSGASQYCFNIGAVLTNIEDLDDANAAYDEAMQSNPRFARACYEKCINLLTNAQTLHGKPSVPDEAFRLLHTYLELEPTGTYAVHSQQILDFLGTNVRTTYTRETAPLGVWQGQSPTATLSEATGRRLLTRKVQPGYPELARIARIEGQVILDALIAKDGTVLSLSVLSGNPFLIESALDAVKQWIYEPQQVFGIPVEMRTQVRVGFILG